MKKWLLFNYSSNLKYILSLQGLLEQPETEQRRNDQS